MRGLILSKVRPIYTKRSRLHAHANRLALPRIAFVSLNFTVFRNRSIEVSSMLGTFSFGHMLHFPEQGRANFLGVTGPTV